MHARTSSIDDRSRWHMIKVGRLWALTRPGTHHDPWCLPFDLIEQGLLFWGYTPVHALRILPVIKYAPFGLRSPSAVIKLRAIWAPARALGR